MDKSHLSHRRFYLFDDTNTQFYLHKSNTANRGWLTDFPTDVKALGGFGQTITPLF